MTTLYQGQLSDWESFDAKPTSKEWVENLESGKVLYFPKLKFDLLEEEKQLLSPDIHYLY